MNTNQTRMRTKPIFPLLVSMALPMMFSMMIQSLYNIIDSIFVAKLGSDAFTAVSLIFPLQNLVLAVAVGFGVGVNSCIAIATGSQDIKRAENAAMSGILLSILHSVLFILFGIFATRPFLQMFTTNEAILNMGSQYGYIVLCLSFGCLIQVCYEKIFQALGNMNITMIVLSVGAVINIILDPIFIFGYLGFPAMGVAGAAIATVCGQISGLFIYIFYYHKKKDSILLQISLKGFSPRIQIIRQLYTVGIPSSIMIALPSILISSLNSMLVRFSSVHVAVLGIYYKLQTFIYLPSGGIVQGMRPIVGFNYGAGEMDRVKKTLDLSLVFTAAIMLVGTLLSLIIPEQLLLMFNANEETLKIGIPALRIISLGFLISSFGVIYSGAFEALGKGLSSLIISLLRQLVIILPLSGLLIPLIGPTGVWITLPIAESIASAISILLIRRTLRKLKHSI